MKTQRMLFAAALALAAGFSATASEAPKSNAKVEVLFAKAADQYTDVRDSVTPSEKGQAANLDALKQYIEERGAKLVSDGQKLTVTLTDVDLAGEYEPWHRAGAEDIRIIKDIYPPRIDLDFKVTNASGAVVKEGKKELRDLSFMLKLSIQRDDPFRYEKELLNDWLRSEFKAAK